MKEKIKSTVIFFIIISLFIQKNEAKVKIREHVNLADTIKFKNFPKEIDIILNEFLKLDDAYVRQLFLNDSSLIILDLKAKSNYFFQQYSLKNKNLIRSFLKRGAKFGEAIVGFSGGIYNNENFWFHDISLSKLVTASITKNSTNDEFVRMTQFNLPYFYHSIQVKDSTTLFAEGARHAENKIQELNLYSGKEKNLFDSYNYRPSNTPYYSWKGAHEGFLYIKPTKDKLVIAYSFTDKIEIFDLKIGKSKIISGPINFETKFTARNREGRDEAVIDEEAKYAFINGFLTDKYIYLLYSGKNGHFAKQDQANLIYVYDWNGSPVAKIKCNKEITAFTVSDDNTVIYAFDQETKYVVSAKLKM